MKLAVLALLVPTVAPAADLVRDAYLQSTTPTSTTIVWTTREDSTGYVRYGPSPLALTSLATSAATGTQHEVQITGLTPDTRYYYAVYAGDGRLAGPDGSHRFTTQPAVGSTGKVRIWVVGDSGTGQADQLAVRDAMLAHVGLDRPDIFVHLGDMAYGGGRELEFTLKFFAPYAGILSNTTVWPVMGNHEGASSNSLTQTGPYYDAYVLPYLAQAGGVASGTEAYYSFDYANIHFVMLDSHGSPREPDGPMLTWARTDLAATDQAWVIAAWHHPPYSHGTHDSDHEQGMVEMRENALPILEAGGVDLVLTGHSHTYERSYLVDGAYETPTTAAGIVDAGSGHPAEHPYAVGVGRQTGDGSVYLVAGHGGAGVGGRGGHPLMYFTEVEHGSVLVDVHDNRLSLTNVRYDGEVTDRMALVKGDAIVVASPDGGDVLTRCGTWTVEWSSVGDVEAVDIDVSEDNGVTWERLAKDVPNTGAWAWEVGDRHTLAGLIRITTFQGTLWDESDARFSVVPDAAVQCAEPEDTGEPVDTAPVDTDDTEVPIDTAESEPPRAEHDTPIVEEPTGCRCGRGGSAGGFGVVALGLVMAWRRRRPDVPRPSG